MRMQVQLLAPLSGLSIQRCRELWHRSQMRLGSCVAVALVYAGRLQVQFDPSPGNFYMMWWGPKKKKGMNREPQKGGSQKDCKTELVGHESGWWELEGKAHVSLLWASHTVPCLCVYWCACSPEIYGKGKRKQGLSWYNPSHCHHGTSVTKWSWLHQDAVWTVTNHQFYFSKEKLG